jgi:hypothetical protein
MPSLRGAKQRGNLTNTRDFLVIRLLRAARNDVPGPFFSILSVLLAAATEAWRLGRH